PSANKRKSLLRKIGNWRNEVQLAIEPRLDRVLVGRKYVSQMPGLQRTHVRIDQFGSGLRRMVMILENEEHCEDGRRSCQGTKCWNEERSSKTNNFRRTSICLLRDLFANSVNHPGRGLLE